jgi:hypothetical protein
MFALPVRVAGRLLDRVKPIVRVFRNRGVRDPSGFAAIVMQHRTLCTLVAERKSFRHRIEKEFFSIENDALFDRIESYDTTYDIAGMFHPEGSQRACGKYLKSLTMKHPATGIFRFVVEFVAESFELAPNMWLREGRSYLQAKAGARPDR